MLPVGRNGESPEPVRASPSGKCVDKIASVLAPTIFGGVVLKARAFGISVTAPRFFEKVDFGFVSAGEIDFDFAATARFVMCASSLESSAAAVAVPTLASFVDWDDPVPRCVDDDLNVITGEAAVVPVKLFGGVGDEPAKLVAAPPLDGLAGPCEEEEAAEGSADD